MTERAETSGAAFWGDADETEALQRYRTLMDTVGDGIYRLDGKGRFAAVNDAIVEMTGYAREDLLGEHVSVILGADSSALEREVERLGTDPSARSEPLECSVQSAEGEQIHCEIRMNPLETDGVGRGTVGIVRELTERDRTEQATSEQRGEHERTIERQRVIQALEAAREGISLLDEDGRFIYVNDAYADTFGYDAEEMIGEHWDELGIEANPDRFHDEILPRIAAEGQWTGTTTCVRSDGDTFPGQHSLTHTEDGELICAVRDVTDRKERERELQRKERRFQAVFEDPNILVGLLDPDGAVLDINQTAMEYIDADLDEVTGEPFWETPWWGKGDEVKSNVKQWTERAVTGEYVDFEADLTSPGGRRYVLDGVFRPVTNDEGDVVSIIVSDRDVTERREIEERLREHERQLSTLMDNVPGMVYRCRNERGWPIEFASDACEELTGYDSAALESGEVGWGEDVMVEEDREMVWETVQEDAGRRETFSETYRIEAADGERRWVRDYGRGVFDEDGEIVGVEGIVSDITERKRLEAELDDVFGRVTDGFFALDEGWNFTYVNEHAHDLINPGGRELKGENVWDLFPDAIGRKFEEQYRRAMAEQVTVSFEEYYPEPLDAWFEVHAYPSETGLSVYFQNVTERKKREQELAESERRYRALAEYFPNGIVTLFDRDHEYTLAAGQGFDRIPVEPEEVEGKRFSEVWDDATAETIEPLFEAALDGEERSVDLSYAGRDWIVHAVPITDERGDVFAGMTMAQDITERTERERELAKYETIVETVNDGIYVKDESGYFTMVNEAYAEMTGYDREELVGEHASLVVDEDAIEQSEEMRAAMVDDDASNPALEAEIQTADGDAVPAEGTFSSLQTDDGKQKQVGVVRDITERKEQRRKIEESERRYRTLAEHFPSGAVGVYDHDLRYTLTEGAVLGDTLPSADRLEGNRIPELFPQETLADLEPLFRAAIEDGDTGTMEATLAGRNWQVWATPLHDADGDVFAGLSFAQDVTEQVQRERRLEELIDKLEASNERLEQFAYAASHDLQEPLRMVSSYLQLIEQRYADELDEDGREFIEFAVDGADRMRNMIEGLLKYSRVDTHGSSFEPVELDAVLDDVLADLQMTVEESDAQITADSLPQVTGDDGQLRQVFQNLLDNAIEYSGDGPPSVQIDAKRNGAEWRISVSDEGLGIDPDDADRIFEVFQSLHAPDDYSGTGIGLALCERIVERHGGDIWVDSEPGEGSTFTFTLPAEGKHSE